MKRTQDNKCSRTWQEKPRSKQMWNNNNLYNNLRL